MSAPGPFSPPQSLSEAPTDLTAYIESKANLCERLGTYQATGDGDDTKEFLEVFFRYLPGDGQNNLANDVLDCNTDKKLRQLVRNLEMGLLIPMKALGGKSVEVSPSPRFGVEDSIENLLPEDIESASRNAQNALREDCLRRDNYQCVVTGAYDENKYSSSYDENEYSSSPGLAPLEAAHIIPYALGTVVTEDDRIRTSKIWNSIFRYFPGVRSRLNMRSDDVNDHRNVMMLWEPLHRQFGAFRMSFAETATINVYELKTFPNFTRLLLPSLPANRRVTFICHDERYPLPHPLLLQMHNAVAHILHATGRAETVEKLKREYGERGGLAPGGQTNIELLLQVSSLAVLEAAGKGDQNRRRRERAQTQKA